MQQSKKYLNLSPLSIALIFLLLIMLAIGTLMQYSAGSGNFYEFAYSYIIKAILGIIVLIIAFNLDLKILFLLAEPIYIFSLFLLILVALVGETRLGAQRWLDLGIFVVQPSEVMKISLALMLAKYFHKFSISQIGKLRFYLIPFLLSIFPFLLVFSQPDLGTALILIMIAATLFFLAGFKLKYFLIICGGLILMLPIIWFSLHDYQKNRVLTFLDPSRDPLGAGYHINQSKIAIGSGGLLGKGYMHGSQSQLDFLPEKHTDFIYTLLSEELGFIGSFIIIFMYGLIIGICMYMSYKCGYLFGSYLIAGVTSIFFIYVFVNIGMVIGILPVVGVPLPLISFGGTSMITNMLGFGLILNVENSKNYS